MSLMKLNVPILCALRCMCMYMEEGTRMQGGVRRRCYMLKCVYIRRKGPVCRAECEDGATIHIYATLLMIENE